MVVRPTSRMLVLMTADTVGGVWNYCARLAGAWQRYEVEVALAAIFVRPEDRMALAHEVNRLIENTSLRREYGRRARLKARKYTLGRMAELPALHRMLRGRRPRRKARTLTAVQGGRN